MAILEKETILFNKEKPMKIHSALMVFLFGVASASQGAIVAQSGLTVERMLTDNVNFGGCMAKITNYDNPAGCSAGWVTFDCEGIYSSKEAGRRAFEIAQMAYALDKTVYIVVESTQKINGYCAVKRIDLYD